MSDISAFNPDSFLEATMSAPSERRSPLPEGTYTAVCGAVSTRSGVSTKDPSNPKPWLSYEIPLSIDVPAELQSGMNLPPTLTVRHQIFADLTPQNTLDESKGRNNGIRLLREALDLNKPGDTFSFKMVEGRVLKASVKHELYNGNIQERVSGVIKA